jgi:hypothetical protein
MKKKKSQKDSKLEKIVDRGKKRLDKFYEMKLKPEKYEKTSQYLSDARIDSSLKAF